MDDTSPKIIPLTEDEEQLLKKYDVSCAKLLPGRWIVSAKMKIEDVVNFEIYEDDVWIVTPPKCGTTWMQELAWLIGNDVDLEKAKIDQFFRVPYLEIGPMIPAEMVEMNKEKLMELGVNDISKYPGSEVPLNEETAVLFMHHSFQYTKTMARPRFIKSHLPICALPKDLLQKCKVIYVGRNIKDAAVSLYHHSKLEGFKGPFKDYADLFRRNLAYYNPFIPHILDAWSKRDHPNLFFTTYEGMSKDLRSVALRLIKFLGKDEGSVDLDKLLAAVHIDAFRKNKFVNKEKEVPPDAEGNQFIRKGIVGDWKNYFDEAMNRDWDPWIQDQLKDTDFEMQFE